MNGGEWALRGYWGTYAVPASVAMLGVALSALVYAWVERFEQDRISAEFQHRSDNIIRVLSSGVDGYANLVESYGNQTAVFTHRMRTTSLSHFLGIREEWEGSKPSIRQSIDDARKHYPGIRVMGWATRVPREQIAPFEHVAETLVTPEYDLKELGSDRVFVPLRDRQEYVPVFYAEPFEDASILLGYDLASSNKIGAALTASLERDGVTASEPIRMIREITGQLGLFIVTPVYQNAARPA